jgi:prefoldin subunit 5
VVEVSAKKARKGAKSSADEAIKLLKDARTALKAASEAVNEALLALV